MKIAVLPGDGIGPEIVKSTLDVLHVADEKFGLGLSYEQHVIGLSSLTANGITF